MLLTRVQVSNFKSFREQEVTFLPQGMNCITGPNGFGKSNLLDAISFSLCSPVSKLRVQAESDLILKNVLASNNVRTCYVILSFDNSRQLVPGYPDRQYQLLTKVICDDKSTAVLHQLNGKTKTKKDIKRFLSDINLDVDDPSFIVYQNSVVQLPFLKPQQLARQILDASGTRTFHENIKRAERDMISWRESESIILKNIELLQARLDEDTKEIRVEKEIKQLKSDVSRAEKTIKSAEDNEQKLRATNLLSEIQQNEALLANFKEDLSRVEQNLSETQTLVAERSSQLNEIVNTIAELELQIEHLSGSIAEQEEYKRFEETEARELMDRKARQESEQQCLIKEKEELNDKLAALRSKKTAVESELSQLNFELEKVSKLKSQEDLRRKVDELRAELRSLQESISIDTQAIESCSLDEQQLTHQKKELEQQLRDCGNVKQRTALLKEEYQSILRSKDNTRRELKETEIKYDTVRRDMSLQRVSAVNEKDLGLLVDLFSVQNGHDEYYDALNQVFKSFVNVRVTLDSNTASQLLKEPSRSARIWALDRLEFKNNEAQMRRIAESYGSEQVVYPVDLLEYESRLSPAIYRVFGSTLITRTDAVGEEIVKRFNVRVVTLKGTTMSSGLMTGGYHANKGNIIRMKMTSFKLAQDLHRLRAEHDAIKKREDEAQALLRDAERELEAERTNEKLRARISKMERSLRATVTNKKQLLEKLERNISRVSVIEQQLQQLSATSGVTNGSKTNVKSLNKQRTKLQKDLDDLARQIELTEARVTAIDVELEHLSRQLTNVEIEKREGNVQDLEALKAKFSEANAQLTSFVASRKQLTADVKKLQNGLVESEEARQDFLKKISAANKQLVQLNKERTRLKIDRDDEDVQMDVEVDVEELKYTAEEIRKKLQTLKSTLRELRKSKNGRANPALIEQREQTLNDFKNKVLVVQQSLKELAIGIQLSIEKINEANNIAFEIVRKEFSKQFATVIPNKRADVRRVNPDGPLEEGIYFVISDINSDEWREGLNELSGGEKTLLAMSFILSTAAFKKRSLYIFDEVDAALDEINSKRLAALINSMLGTSQVICVSHNQNFSKQGAREIQITKEGFYSKVAKIVERSN